VKSVHGGAEEVCTLLGVQARKAGPLQELPREWIEELLKVLYVVKMEPLLEDRGKVAPPCTYMDERGIRSAAMEAEAAV
jgi:hypothetical protein